MSPALPAWSHAQVLVSHSGLSVGVFPSTKPWMPRHKERRFLAVALGAVDPDETPNGGSPLPSLLDSINRTIEERDFAVLAGEAEGHRSLVLQSGGDDWTVVVAADAWIAVGPRISGPQGIQVGPHALDLAHLEFGRRPEPSTNDGSSAVF